MSTKKGMSSNVLNMKFMRAAEIKEEEKKVEEKVAKLKDLSEWKREGSESLKAKTLTKPKVVSMGFSALNSLSQTQQVPMVGRRRFGDEPKKEVKNKNSEEEGEENDIDRAFRLEKQERENKKAVKRSLGSSTSIPKSKKMKS